MALSNSQYDHLMRTYEQKQLLGLPRAGQEDRWTSPVRRSQEELWQR